MAAKRSQDPIAGFDDLKKPKLDFETIDECDSEVSGRADENHFASSDNNMTGCTEPVQVTNDQLTGKQKQENVQDHAQLGSNNLGTSSVRGMLEAPDISEPGTELILEPGTGFKPPLNAESKLEPSTDTNLEPSLETKLEPSAESETEPCTGVKPEQCTESKEPDIDVKQEPALLHPLSYTKADEFTSEIYKIQIYNLPKFGFNDLKKRLKSSLKLNPHKIKSDRRYVTYVCFKNAADRDEALQKINGHVWKGKTLEAKIAAPVADPYLQKKHQQTGNGQAENTTKAYTEPENPEESKQITPEEAEARLRANVSPLWETDYGQQLQIKTEKVKDILKQVTRNSFVKNLFKDRSFHDGLACQLLPIIPSPVTSEYRNKNEFTVGYGLDGQVLVGFRYGMYKDGTTSVGDPTTLGIAMPAAIPVVKSFREFVSNSKWLPYRQETGTGNWQTLTVRTFQTGDVMAVVDFVPRKMEQPEIESVKSSLKEFYTEGGGTEVKITSFYFRVGGGKGQTVKSSSELLFGEPHVYESLLDLRFRISPEAFFQVNTAATENLYRLISEWCNVSPSTTVLDICCGTGTIGLSMAKNVRQVVGIEMCSQAIEDARVNSSINGITNASFHCAKVENVINKTISSLQATSSLGEVVAVVDPPRAGLHKDVIKTLRRCSRIQRLVYVSCNPESAKDNFIDLIRPETGRHNGAPFKMIKAVPVDLFPGTRHCELVILFTRGAQDLADGSPSVTQQFTDCTGNGILGEDITELSTGANSINEDNSVVLT